MSTSSPKAALNDEQVAELTFMETQLQDLLRRKRLVDKHLSQLEQSIYRFEGTYLEDTKLGGNIIRGFENYTATQRGLLSTGNSSLMNSKNSSNRGGIGPGSEDRIFSHSSSTFLRSSGYSEEDARQIPIPSRLTQKNVNFMQNDKKYTPEHAYEKENHLSRLPSPPSRPDFGEEAEIATPVPMYTSEVVQEFAREEDEEEDEERTSKDGEWSDEQSSKRRRVEVQDDGDYEANSDDDR